MPDRTDDALGDRLGAALGSLRAGEVDAPALVEGSRNRARTIRNRRVGAVTAAVVLVIGVPVALTSLHEEEPDPAAVLASPPPPTPLRVTASRSASPEPAPTAEPTRSRPDRIPDSAGLTADDLPDGQDLVDGTDSLARQPTVFGQVCTSTWDTGDRPEVGRTWSWADRSGGENGATVGLVVTRWKAGTGDDRFTDVVTNTGYCRFLEPQVPQVAAVPGATQVWAATAQEHDRRYARVAVRVGDLIAGITVQDAADPQAALDTARTLAALLPLRLSGLDMRPSPT